MTTNDAAERLRDYIRFMSPKYDTAEQFEADLDAALAAAYRAGQDAARRKTSRATVERIREALAAEWEEPIFKERLNAILDAEAER